MDGCFLLRPIHCPRPNAFRYLGLGAFSDNPIQIRAPFFIGKQHRRCTGIVLPPLGGVLGGFLGEVDQYRSPEPDLYLVKI